MAKAVKKAKRNPQDSTLRNVRANAKRDAALSEQVASMSVVVQDLTRRVEALEGHTRINMVVPAGTIPQRP